MTEEEYDNMTEEQMTAYREDPKNYVFRYKPAGTGNPNNWDYEESLWFIGLRFIFEQGYGDDGFMEWPYELGLEDETEGVYSIGLHSKHLTNDQEVTNALLKLGVDYEPTYAEGYGDDSE